jgi:hypothetical protein
MDRKIPLRSKLSPHKLHTLPHKNTARMSVKPWGEAMEAVDGWMDDLQKTVEDVEKSIHDYFESLEKALTHRKTQLVERLHDIRRYNEQILIKHKEIIQCDDPPDPLSVLQPLTMNFEKLRFVPKAKLKESIGKSGKIKGIQHGRPYKVCIIDGMIEAQTLSGNVIFDVYDVLDTKCTTMNQELLSFSVDRPLNCASSISRFKKARIIISFIATERCQSDEMVRITLQYDGQHLLQSSPHLLLKPRDETSGKILVETSTLRPKRVLSSCVYGAELFTTALNSVCVYDLVGKFRRQWGVFGINPGEFDNPCAIAVFCHEVFVADLRNNRVQVFSLGGVYGRSIDFPKPCFLVVHLNLLWISNFQTIQALSSNGSVEYNFALSASNISRISLWKDMPYFVVTDKSNRTFVHCPGGKSAINLNERQYQAFGDFLVSIDQEGVLRITNESLLIIFQKKIDRLYGKKWLMALLPCGKLTMIDSNNHFLVIIDSGLDTTSNTRLFLKFIHEESVRRCLDLKDISKMLIPMYREYYLIGKKSTLLSVDPVSTDDVKDQIELKFCWKGEQVDVSNLTMDRIKFNSFTQHGADNLQVFTLELNSGSNKAFLKRSSAFVDRKFQVLVSFTYRGAELINSPLVLQLA